MPEDETHIIERWNAVQKELGNATPSSVGKTLHHHPFKFKHTSHMSIHDMRQLLEEKGMKKSMAVDLEDQHHDEKIHHQIFHMRHFHTAKTMATAAEPVNQLA